MAGADSEIIEYTLRTWQPRTTLDLTAEDARQIIENVAGFFTVLNRWQEKERTAAGVSTDEGGVPVEA